MTASIQSLRHRGKAMGRGGVDEGGGLQYWFGEPSQMLWNGVAIAVTRTEFDMVVAIHGHGGASVSYRELYDLVHGRPGLVAGRGPNGHHANVRTFIKRIRKKFRAIDPSFEGIECDRAFGYRWTGKAPAMEHRVCISVDETGGIEVSADVPLRVYVVNARVRDHQVRWLAEGRGLNTGPQCVRRVLNADPVGRLRDGRKRASRGKPDSDALPRATPAANAMPTPTTAA